MLYQILQTNIMTIVWQIVWRITNKILGVKELSKATVLAGILWLRQFKPMHKGSLKKSSLQKDSIQNQYEYSPYSSSYIS